MSPLHIHDCEFDAMSDKGAITCTHPDQDSCQARNVNTCSGATCEKRSMHSAWSNAVHKQYLHRVDTFETTRYQFNNGHTAAGEQGTGSIGAYGVDTRGTRDIMDAWMHACRPVVFFVHCPHAIQKLHQRLHRRLLDSHRRAYTRCRRGSVRPCGHGSL